jgi:hypothetical protein
MLTLSKRRRLLFRKTLDGKVVECMDKVSDERHRP